MAAPDLYWRDLAHGPQPALALHCTLAHSGAWQGLADHLATTLTLHAPDAPGHGKSPPYDGTSCTGSLLLEAIEDRIHEPVDVLGHSFGGVVGLALAVRRPDLVRSLTLYEPVLFALSKEVDPAGFAEHERHMCRVVDCIAEGDFHKAAQGFVGAWGDGRPWEALPESTRARFGQLMPFLVGSEGYIGRDEAGTIPRLGEIGVPTLIMDGALSPPVMGRLCDALAARIDGARRVTLQGAGHMGPISHPGAVAVEVQRLLDRR